MSFQDVNPNTIVHYVSHCSRCRHVIGHTEKPLGNQTILCRKCYLELLKNH